jgi:hypothetical protein
MKEVLKKEVGYGDFLDVVKCFPRDINLVSGRLNFYAGGIPKRPSGDESVIFGFNECHETTTGLVEQGIMPNSFANLDYSIVRNYFRWSRAELTDGNHMSNLDDADLKKRADELVISGGKLRRITFNFRDTYENDGNLFLPGMEGFQRFREVMLSPLVEGGYMLDWGRLDFTTAQDGDGFIAVDSLKMSRQESGNYNLELRVGTETSEDETRKIVEWFN